MGPILGVPPVKRGRGSTVTSELTERKTVEKVRVRAVTSPSSEVTVGGGLPRSCDVCVCVFQEVEMVVKASVRTPDLGAQSHMVVGITQQETLERPVRTVSQECAVSPGGAGESAQWGQSWKK